MFIWDFVSTKALVPFGFMIWQLSFIRKFCFDDFLCLRKMHEVTKLQLGSVKCFENACFGPSLFPNFLCCLSKRAFMVNIMNVGLQNFLGS